MEVPSNCKRIPKHEQHHVAKALAHRNFSQPHFAIYDDVFLEILGDTPTIELGLEKDWPFAHEAGVYIPDLDAIYITSNILSTETGRTIKIGKLTRQSGQWQYEEIQNDIAMGNGAINYDGGVLFCDQGTKTVPGGLVHMEVSFPYTTKTLVSSYHWRQFSSINDVVVHSDGSVWFTDPNYGFQQGFRAEPQLPCQVYRFGPESRDLRVVADGFGKPNGLCFSPDEETMYVTDTDWIQGDGTKDFTRASHIYAFDVIDRHNSHFLANRRVFAMADEGVPDGIKCDVLGNVYSGCGDGVHVWTPGGKLIGKIKVSGGISNFCFGRKGEIFLLNETRFWIAHVSTKVHGALLANMSIEV